jgi:hypothetical protein
MTDFTNPVPVNGYMLLKWRKAQPFDITLGHELAEWGARRKEIN